MLCSIFIYSDLVTTIVMLTPLQKSYECYLYVDYQDYLYRPFSCRD